MKVEALKALTFSRDGVTPLRAAAGEVVDVPDAFVAGLVREGFVRVPAWPPLENRAMKRAPEVKHPIPANWRDLPWPAMRSLAASVSAGPVRNKDDAEAAIVAAGG